jgi:hypothetical protein
MLFYRCLSSRILLGEPVHKSHRAQSPFQHCRNRDSTGKGFLSCAKGENRKKGGGNQKINSFHGINFLGG